MADALKERAAGWPGVTAAVIHSRLGRREREEEWRALLEGRANLAVGPRSALLAPLDRLGLVIVDEEHDDSYAQQEGQLYDARRGACLRAGAGNAVVVFGSSTPSVEAYHRAREDGTLIALPGPAPKFRTSVVDDRGAKGALSSALLNGSRSVSIAASRSSSSSTGGATPRPSIVRPAAIRPGARAATSP